MKIDLSGKVAVVTGATGQLGRVMVRTLAASGADVAVNYLHDKEMAEKLAGEAKAMGRRAFAVMADITNEESVNALQKAVAGELGDADIVVNNAVIQYKWTSILEQPLTDFYSQFESCVMQSVLTARAFLPAMVKKGAGRFIGINSECYALCNANSGAYAAGKNGMHGLYKVLAKEVGASGVTVNQVSPGWTVSERDRQNGTEDAPNRSAMIPLDRRGTDQELANTVLYLASDLSSFITGVNVPASGGTYML